MTQIEEFLKKHYPDILSQYHCYVSSKPPEIGVKVKSLYFGLGGKPGNLLTVKGYGYKGEQSGRNSTWEDDYVILRGKEGDHFIKMHEWWKLIILVSE